MTDQYRLLFPVTALAVNRRSNGSTADLGQVVNWYIARKCQNRDHPDSQDNWGNWYVFQTHAWW